MATVVTNVGKGLITARFLAAAAALSFYLGWGTGAGTSAATDTTLFTESAESRAAATVTQQTTTTTNDTVQFLGTLTATGTRTITNAGVFDASSSGNMLMKGDFTGVALSTGDSIAFTMKIQFS